MRRIGTFIFLVLLVPAGFACRKGGGGGSGGGGGGWLVARDGNMFNVDPWSPEKARVYHASTREDLLGIACRGARDAWVVGTSGAALRTTDGGRTWGSIATEVTTTLHDVAAAGQDVVYAVGDAGVFLRSQDSGAVFARVIAPAVDFSAVATTFRGDVALLAARDGSIWRYRVDLHAIQEARPATGVALLGIAISADGRDATTVGAGGRWLASGDGGITWQTRAIDTIRDLHDVWLVQDGLRAIAVGDAGVVVDVRSAADVHIQELLEPGRSLRGLHLHADGTGMAVGDRGAIFETDDAGLSFWALPGITTIDLFDVDALHGEPHL